MNKFLILILIISLVISKNSNDEEKRKTKIRNLEDDSSTDVNFLEERKVKPTVLGIGGFSNTTTGTQTNIKLTVYFKNIANAKNSNSIFSIFLKYLYFKAIFKKNTIRNLQNSEEIILCGNLSNSPTDDIVSYKVDETIKIDSFYNIDVKPNFQFLDEFLELKDRNLSYSLKIALSDDKNSDAITSPNLDISNVGDKEKDFDPKKILFFYVFDINHLGYLHYKIKGFFNQNIDLKKETLSFTYKQFSDVKNFLGTLERDPDRDNNNYTLTFTFNDIIYANLDEGCSADISHLKIRATSRIRRLQDDFKEKLMLYALEGVSLELEETNPPDPINYFGKRDNSSSGLSGGAIAGIVIGTVVALVCLTLAILYFNKPNIGHKDGNEIEFYNNNKSNVNSSVNMFQ